MTVPVIRYDRTGKIVEGWIEADDDYAPGERELVLEESAVDVPRAFRGGYRIERRRGGPALVPVADYDDPPVVPRLEQRLRRLEAQVDST